MPKIFTIKRPRKAKKHHHRHQQPIPVNNSQSSDNVQQRLNESPGRDDDISFINIPFGGLTNRSGYGYGEGDVDDFNASDDCTAPHNSTRSGISSEDDQLCPRVPACSPRLYHMQGENGKPNGFRRKKRISRSATMPYNSETRMFWLHSWSLAGAVRPGGDVCSTTEAERESSHDSKDEPSDAMSLSSDSADIPDYILAVDPKSDRSYPVRDPKAVARCMNEWEQLPDLIEVPTVPPLADAGVVLSQPSCMRETMDDKVRVSGLAEPRPYATDNLRRRLLFLRSLEIHQNQLKENKMQLMQQKNKKRPGGPPVQDSSPERIQQGGRPVSATTHNQSAARLQRRSYRPKSSPQSTRVPEETAIDLHVVGNQEPIRGQCIVPTELENGKPKGDPLAEEMRNMTWEEYADFYPNCFFQEVTPSMTPKPAGSFIQQRHSLMVNGRQIPIYDYPSDSDPSKEPETKRHIGPVRGFHQMWESLFGERNITLTDNKTADKDFGDVRPQVHVSLPKQKINKTVDKDFGDIRPQVHVSLPTQKDRGAVIKYYRPLPYQNSCDVTPRVPPRKPFKSRSDGISLPCPKNVQQPVTDREISYVDWLRAHAPKADSSEYLRKLEKPLPKLNLHAEKSEHKTAHETSSEDSVSPCRSCLDDTKLFFLTENCEEVKSDTPRPRRARPVSGPTVRPRPVTGSTVRLSTSDTIPSRRTTDGPQLGTYRPTSLSVTKLQHSEREMTVDSVRQPANTPQPPRSLSDGSSSERSTSFYTPPGRPNTANTVAPFWELKICNQCDQSFICPPEDEKEPVLRNAFNVQRAYGPVNAGRKKPFKVVLVGRGINRNENEGVVSLLAVSSSHPNCPRRGARPINRSAQPPRKRQRSKPDVGVYHTCLAKSCQDKSTTSLVNVTANTPHDEYAKFAELKKTMKKGARMNTKSLADMAMEDILSKVKQNNIKKRKALMGQNCPLPLQGSSSSCFLTQQETYTVKKSQSEQRDLSGQMPGVKNSTLNKLLLGVSAGTDLEERTSTNPQTSEQRAATRMSSAAKRRETLRYVSQVNRPSTVLDSTRAEYYTQSESGRRHKFTRGSKERGPVDHDAQTDADDKITISEVLSLSDVTATTSRVRKGLTSRQRNVSSQQLSMLTKVSEWQARNLSNGLSLKRLITKPPQRIPNNTSTLDAQALLSDPNTIAKFKFLHPQDIEKAIINSAKETKNIEKTLLTSSKESQNSEKAISTCSKESQNFEKAILTISKESQIRETAILTRSKESQIKETAILTRSKESQNSEKTKLPSSKESQTPQLLSASNTQVTACDDSSQHSKSQEQVKRKEKDGQCQSLASSVDKSHSVSAWLLSETNSHCSFLDNLCKSAPKTWLSKCPRRVNSISKTITPEHFKWKECMYSLTKFFQNRKSSPFFVLKGENPEFTRKMPKHVREISSCHKCKERSQRQMTDLQSRTKMETEKQQMTNVQSRTKTEKPEKQQLTQLEVLLRSNREDRQLMLQRINEGVAAEEETKATLAHKQAIRGRRSKTQKAVSFNDQATGNDHHDATFADGQKNDIKSKTRKTISCDDDQAMGDATDSSEQMHIQGQMVTLAQAQYSSILDNLDPKWQKIMKQIQTDFPDTLQEQRNTLRLTARILHRYKQFKREEEQKARAALALKKERQNRRRRLKKESLRLRLGDQNISDGDEEVSEGAQSPAPSTVGVHSTLAPNPSPSSQLVSMSRESERDHFQFINGYTEEDYIARKIEDSCEEESVHREDYKIDQDCSELNDNCSEADEDYLEVNEDCYEDRSEANDSGSEATEYGYEDRSEVNEDGSEENESRSEANNDDYEDRSEANEDYCEENQDCSEVSDVCSEADTSDDEIQSNLFDEGLELDLNSADEIDVTEVDADSYTTHATTDDFDVVHDEKAEATDIECRSVNSEGTEVNTKTSGSQRDSSSCAATADDCSINDVESTEQQQDSDIHQKENEGSEDEETHLSDGDECSSGSGETDVGSRASRHEQRSSKRSKTPESEQRVDSEQSADTGSERDEDGGKGAEHNSGDFKRGSPMSDHSSSEGEEASRRSSGDLSSKHEHSARSESSKRSKTSGKMQNSARSDSSGKSKNSSRQSERLPSTPNYKRKNPVESLQRSARDTSRGNSSDCRQSTASSADTFEFAQLSWSCEGAQELEPSSPMSDRTSRQVSVRSELDKFQRGKGQRMSARSEPGQGQRGSAMSELGRIRQVSARWQAHVCRTGSLSSRVPTEKDLFSRVNSIRRDAVSTLYFSLHDKAIVSGNSAIDAGEFGCDIPATQDTVDQGGSKKTSPTSEQGQSYKPNEAPARSKKLEASSPREAETPIRPHKTVRNTHSAKQHGDFQQTSLTSDVSGAEGGGESVHSLTLLSRREIEHRINAAEAYIHQHTHDFFDNTVLAEGSHTGFKENDGTEGFQQNYDSKGIQHNPVTERRRQKQNVTAQKNKRKGKPFMDRSAMKKEKDIAEISSDDFEDITETLEDFSETSGTDIITDKTSAYSEGSKTEPKKNKSEVAKSSEEQSSATSGSSDKDECILGYTWRECKKEESKMAERERMKILSKRKMQDICRQMTDLERSHKIKSTLKKAITEMNKNSYDRFQRARNYHV